jgi:SAM-dependent methyltransferase
MSVHSAIGSDDQRFAFGENWTRFLSVVTEHHISVAEDALKCMLRVEDLAGASFLDVGSGSGLMSLAARRLGATVHSFDYDLQSVWCTQELRNRFHPSDPDWIVEKGSVLDRDYLGELGQFDYVYSWGVLHHTGAMWQALDNVVGLVCTGGKLFISIYNDQGRRSRQWRVVKRTYNRLPHELRFLVPVAALVPLWGPTMLRDLLIARPFHSWRDYSSNRGMSAWHDVVDWVGGYPFEVAKPEEVFAWGRSHGFVLDCLKTCGGSLGCNEYVFVKS